MPCLEFKPSDLNFPRNLKVSQMKTAVSGCARTQSPRPPCPAVFVTSNN